MLRSTEQAGFTNVSRVSALPGFALAEASHMPGPVSRVPAVFPGLSSTVTAQGKELCCHRELPRSRSGCAGVVDTGSWRLWGLP